MANISIWSKRFIEDDGFQALNGIGGLLIHYIDTFPPSYEEYKKNPDQAKERLKTPMKELKDRFQRKALLRAFLSKSIFNGGEIDYLTVFDNGKFNVFSCKDVVKVLGDVFNVSNSEMRSVGQHAEQKALFKYEDKNTGELEIRNNSEKHYQEVRFNMIKPRVMTILYKYISNKKDYNDNVIVYGEAVKRFGNWNNAN